MQFCEQDCAVYTMLKEEGVCTSTLDLIREFAAGVGNYHLTTSINIFEKFDCYNASTYQFSESDDYAETCTGLISTQSKSKYIDLYLLSA